MAIRAGSRVRGVARGWRGSYYCADGNVNLPAECEQLGQAHPVLWVASWVKRGGEGEARGRERRKKTVRVRDVRFLGLT